MARLGPGERTLSEHPAFGYAVAGGCVLIAATAQALCAAWLGEERSYGFFLASVGVVAMWAGARPALLAALGGLILSASSPTPTEWTRPAEYVLGAAALIVCATRLRVSSSRDRAAPAHDAGVRSVDTLGGDGEAANERLPGILADASEQERSEGELRESEQRLRRTIEGAEIGTFDSDFAAKRVRYSPAACDLLGIPAGSEPALGDSFEFAPPEVRDKLRATFAASLDASGDGRFRDETPILRAGEVRFISYRGRVEFRDTPSGRVPWRAVGVILDVTEHRRAESALRESEQQWRLAFEANAIGGFSADLESGSVEASPELRRLLGISELAPNSVAEAQAIIEPDDLVELRARFAAALSPNSDGRVQMDLRLRSNHRWLAVSALTEFRITPEGRVPVRVLGVAVDIGDRKRNEAALRDGEALFRVFVNNSAVIAWLKDSDGRYVFMSENYERRFGLESSNCLGKTDFELFPLELAEAYRRNDEQVLSSGAALEVAEEGVAANGQRSWWLSAKLPFESSSGARFVAGLAVDITPEREAQAHIRNADRRKDEFIAILAHELRNPLAPLINAARVLSDGTADDSQQYWCDVIARQVQHMSLLLDDLLDVSRISLGKLKIHRQRIELAKIVEGALEIVQPLIENTKHRLTVTVPSSPVWLDGDPVRLIQVLTNLLNNAVRYSPPGCMICLIAEADERTAMIRVKDEGIGIAAENLGGVFEFFSSSARSSASGGLGIGLALSRKLVELHGGELTAVSDGVGAGSEFRVSLASAAPPDDVHDSRRSQPELRLPNQSRRVLIADDLADSADSMAMALRMAGHEVATAYDGAEAVEIAERFRPEVVVLDIGMPKLDGYEACRRILSQCAGGPAVMIALTGWGDPEERERTRQAGFDHHLTKPVDPKVLRDLISVERDSRSLKA